MSESIIKFDDGASTILESWGSAGPAIVCVHGITSSRKSWLRLAERLAGCYRIFAYDQRGHGDAAGVKGPMRLDCAVADLRAILTQIRVDPTFIVGHSWGGAVVILAGHDSDVRGVIAIDPMLRVVPGSWEREYLDDARALLQKSPREREQSIRESLSAAWHPLDIEGKVHAVASMTSEPIARLGTENAVDSGGWNLLARVERYPKPLLLLAAGPEDSVLSADDLAHVKARGGPNVTVKEFPAEGHNLHRTAFDAFATEVEAFLARTM